MCFVMEKNKSLVRYGMWVLKHNCKAVHCNYHLPYERKSLKLSFSMYTATCMHLFAYINLPTSTY